LFNNALDSERKWSNDMIHMSKMIDEVDNWWDYPIDRMNVTQLQFVKDGFEGAKETYC
jgi:hypothetical protein